MPGREQLEGVRTPTHSRNPANAAVYQLIYVSAPHGGRQVPFSTYCPLIAHHFSTRCQTSPAYRVHKSRTERRI